MKFLDETPRFMFFTAKAGLGRLLSPALPPSLAEQGARVLLG